MISLSDYLVQFQNDIYEILLENDLEKKIQCKKNKNGFKMTITFSKDKKENQEAENAVRDFFINL